MSHPYHESDSVQAIVFFEQIWEMSPAIATVNPRHILCIRSNFTV